MAGIRVDGSRRRAPSTTIRIVLVGSAARPDCRRAAARDRARLGRPRRGSAHRIPHTRRPPAPAGRLPGAGRPRSARCRRRAGSSRRWVAPAAISDGDRVAIGVGQQRSARRRRAPSPNTAPRAAWPLRRNGDVVGRPAAEAVRGRARQVRCEPVVVDAAGQERRAALVVAALVESRRRARAGGFCTRYAPRFHSADRDGCGSNRASLANATRHNASAQRWLNGNGRRVACAAFADGATPRMKYARAHVVGAQPRERRVRHRRIEPAAVRAHAAPQCVVELLQRVVADPVGRVRRDVRRIDRPERRVHWLGRACVVGRVVAGRAVAGVREVTARERRGVGVAAAALTAGRRVAASGSRGRCGGCRGGVAAAPGCASRGSWLHARPSTQGTRRRPAPNPDEGQPGASVGTEADDAGSVASSVRAVSSCGLQPASAHGKRRKRRKRTERDAARRTGPREPERVEEQVQDRDQCHGLQGPRKP